MSLPLPNLDTRRWTDLVEEGRSLIPRFAPTWTDHNVHDPGIMLLELFAWLTEQLIYRANRVPERHVRKFLALAGYLPEPPRPAMTLVRFAPDHLTLGALDLPAGLLIATEPGDAAAPFRTLTAVAVTEPELVA